MSEYRAQVNISYQANLRKLTKEEEKEEIDALPDFIRESFVNVDLFKKYGMNEAIRLAKIKADSIVKRENNEASFGDRYYFWKEEPKFNSSANHHHHQHVPPVVTVKTEPVDSSSSVLQEEVPVAAAVAYVEPEKRLSVHYMTFERLGEEEVRQKLSVEMATIALPYLYYCRMMGILFEGVFFALLMTHHLKDKKKDTNIAVTKNPIFTVMCHNNQAKDLQKNAATLAAEKGAANHRHLRPDGTPFFPFIVDKDTATAAPFWRLDVVLGRFLTREKAIECCLEWVQKTRGTDPKRKKSIDLGKEFRTKRYSSQIKLQDHCGVSIEKRLYQMNVPGSYIEKYQEIATSNKNLIQSL